MEGTLKLNPNMHKLYMTGHSRAGMLSQRAAVRLVELEKDELLERLTYFNGLGVVMNTGKIRDVLNDLKDIITIKPPVLGEMNEPSIVDKEDIDRVRKVFKIKEKIVSIHIIGDKEKGDPFPYVDLVGILGIHVGGRYIQSITAIAKEKADGDIKAYHSMSNFTYHIYRGYIKEYDHVQDT